VPTLGKKTQKGSRTAVGLLAPALYSLTMHVVPWRAGMCALALTLFPAAAVAQNADNLLLVVNESSPASTQVGDYYARKRSVPTDHVVRIKTPVADEIEREEYVRAIEGPIGAWLSRNNLQDKVLYLVLTKGVPLRITGTTGREGTTSSVDSELTLLYRKLVGMASPIAGRVPNSYFLADRPLAAAKPFTRLDADIYLVARLDGFTVDEVLKLIDRGAAPSPSGRIVLDQKSTIADAGGDQWLQQTADRLRQANAADRVVLEESRSIASADGPVIGYFSWGSNDPANQLRRFGLTFSPGAIAGMFVSTDGRTFNEPPADWKPSDPNGRGPRFGGSFQSLAGDLIRDGVTGVSAHVAEPYLDATIRPQILFPAYLSGMNLAESFYLAMPYLSWQTVIVGDPLCTPFPRRTLSASELSKGIDPETELPALFAERKLAVLSRTGGLSAEGLKLMMQADGQAARGDKAGSERTLLRAVQVEPRLSGANLRLAAADEEAGEYTKAIERYRAVLAVDPRNVIALNNLAYALAERQNAPKEAVPFAERAYRAAPRAETADTLGWIYHLLGDDQAAGPLMDRAAATSTDPETFIHAAIVHAALGNRVKAKAELEAAEKLDGRVSDRAEVKALKQKLGGA
jgi:uncharacterized protein (TIGR03790 family)